MAPQATGSLLLSEIHRFSARRFIRVSLALAALGYVAIVGLMAFTVFAKPDARRGETRPPFVLADLLPAGAGVVAMLTAMLAFVIGATYVGAEWSTRSMVALLFWEPRRPRVVGTKLAVAAGAGAILGVVAQAAWVLTSLFLASTRGTATRLPSGFWRDVIAQQSRGVLLVALMALLGFSIANLVRNTGAALGVGFVYFAILERIIGSVRPAWQEWLLLPNIGALLADGGTRMMVGPGIGQSGEPHEIVLSNLHGALVITGFTALIVGAGVVLFQRRDLH